MKKLIFGGLLILLISSQSCLQDKNSNKMRFVTLDPGHFHAALVQKTMYGDVDSNVFVYAPSGEDVKLHLNIISGYNQRKTDPTHWKEKIYIGNDFLNRMLTEKAGNVVVIAGNNQRKTEYILKSLEAGFNVLADKPMAINSQNFELLRKAFEIAHKKDLKLYDIMTERFEITNILQRELSRIPGIFGTLEKGTPENPAIVMESIHYFLKNVSGNALTRPVWFFDVSQEGEGMTDVATHLVDLVQWECFPEQIIDYSKDIQLLNSRHWPTNLTIGEFKTVTKQAVFPEYLKKNVIKDSILQVYANGEINYKLKDVYVRISALWNYKALDGGDSHYSLLRGTKADLLIKQGAEQHFKPTLYIINKTGLLNENVLLRQIANLQKKYPGIGLKKINQDFEVVIPEKYKVGHEAHFARVTRNYLDYLKGKEMPAWEVPNMLAKYYITTGALKMAVK